MASPTTVDALRSSDPVAPYRKHSQESSPPPSPTTATNIHRYSHVDTALTSPRSLPSLPPVSSVIVPSKPAPLGANVNASSRPKLPGRQETPPSPPNSVLLQSHRGSPITPVDAMGAVDSKVAQGHSDVGIDSRHNSLMDKFARVFRGHRRVSSENSWSTKGGYRRHRKDNSHSTNSTANPFSLHYAMASSHTSLQDDLEPPTEKQGLYPQATNISPNISPISASSASQGISGSSTGRRVINGGEVRIEIFPQQQQQQQSAVENVALLGNNDRSMKYYDYYTRSKPTSPSGSQGDDASEHDVSPVRSVPSLSLTTQPQSRRVLQPRNDLVRKGTANTQSSSESRERMFVEESMAREYGVDLPSAEAPAGPFRTDSETSLRPFDGTSRKASSSVLNTPSRSDSSNSRSQSSLARNGTTGSTSRRPVMKREMSSSSFIINGRISAQGIGGNSTGEQFAQGLKRLSKISAGSGVSGVAIVVTADGPASTRHSAVSEDGDADDRHGGSRWTREEKGKARASPSEPGTHDQRSHTCSRSGQSQRTVGTEPTRSSEDHDDSKSLLPVIPDIIQTRKLKAQEPNENIIVHPGDPRYEFTYRMRQTSDDNRVFVPQYHYDAPFSFPNRNALGAPTAAQPPKTADGSPYPPSSLVNRVGGSILKRPPSAILRSSATNSFVGDIPQGDDTYDVPPGKSQKVRESQTHPALREPRSGDSMTSLEFFTRAGHFSAQQNRPDTGRPSQDVATSEDGQRTTSHKNGLLQPPQEAHRSSWDPSRFLGQLPARPRQFMRRSLTPHLYNPQDVDLDPTKVDQDHTTAHRQRKIGRLLLLACVLFPPLWFVMACGGFDSFIASWTSGAVRGVGSGERKIALVLATVVCIGTVVGVVVGISVASTAA